MDKNDVLRKIEDNKSKLIKISLGVLCAITIMFGISVYKAMDKVGKYTFDKPYEELTFTEKVAAKVKGYNFYTKKELEDKGFILSDEKKEAKAISDIYKEILQLMKTSDNQNTDEKIKKCDDILDRLHKENSSGNVKGENLINFMDESIDTVSNYKLKLQALKKVNAKEYKEYNEKIDNNFKKLDNDLDRLGFK